ncbi:hypothetical protein ACE6H2_016190 [Prunus campanulata]
MTRGKQKIEAQKRNAEKNQKQKGSQFEARAVALKITCPICKPYLDINLNNLSLHWIRDIYRFWIGLFIVVIGLDGDWVEVVSGGDRCSRYDACFLVLMGQ